MLTPFMNRMHRHTRPAEYVDKAAHERSIRSQRPGGHGFSFTGDFPEVIDTNPVVATERRRNYVNPVNTGSYQAMGSMDAARVPAVSRYGVSLVPAVVMLFVASVILGMMLLMSWSDVSETAKHISDQQMRMTELGGLTAEAEYQIAEYSNDVNIRQEAVRLGMINSKGVDVIYLTAPEAANFCPSGMVSSANLASVTGQ